MLLDKSKDFVTCVGGEVAYVQDGDGYHANGEWLGNVDENNNLVKSDEANTDLITKRPYHKR